MISFGRSFPSTAEFWNREFEAPLAFRVGMGPTSLGAKYVTGNSPSGAIPI
jgi:hypothetical protein